MSGRFGAGAEGDVMSGEITGYTEVRELDLRLTERTVQAVHDATGDHVIVRYLSEDVHIDQVREHLGRLSMVDSRYVVRVREVVLEETRCAVVLEPVDGLSLRAILDDQGVMTVEAALYVLRGSLCGLAAAHAAAVSYRAYRPESVLIGFDGEVRLFDFGLRAVAAEDEATADIHAAVITFVEILTGASALSLDLAEVVAAAPPTLRALVRTGLSGTVDVVALLASLDAIAVAECGAQWAQRGRLWLALRAEELRVEQLRAEAALVGADWSDRARAAGVAGLLVAEELRLRGLREQELRQRLAHTVALRAEAAAAQQRWAAEYHGSGQPAPATPAAPVVAGTSASRQPRHRGRLVLAGMFLLLICGAFLTWFLAYRGTPASSSPEVPVAASPTGSPSTVPTVPAVPAASQSPQSSPSASMTRRAPLPPVPTASWSPVPKGRSEGGTSPTPTANVTVTPSPTPSPTPSASSPSTP